MTHIIAQGAGREAETLGLFITAFRSLQGGNRLKSEREARFQQYYRSLNLDDAHTELPGHNTQADGRQEKIMYQSKS